jgi:hypothetical protein
MARAPHALLFYGLQLNFSVRQPHHSSPDSYLTRARSHNASSQCHRRTPIWRPIRALGRPGVPQPRCVALRGDSYKPHARSVDLYRCRSRRWNDSRSTLTARAECSGLLPDSRASSCGFRRWHHPDARRCVGDLGRDPVGTLFGLTRGGHISDRQSDECPPAR